MKNKYKLLNSYFNLARGGVVEPLKCPDCGLEYTLWIPDDDIELENPVLKCWNCNSETSLGTQTLRDIEAVVNDKISYFPHTSED